MQILVYQQNDITIVVLISPTKLNRLSCLVLYCCIRYTTDLCQALIYFSFLSGMQWNIEEKTEFCSEPEATH